MRWVACAAYMKGNENCIRNSGQKTVETNQGVGKGTKLNVFWSSAFQTFFLMYHCHNTKHVHGPLSQYNIYICIPLGIENINGYIQDMVLPGCFNGRLKRQHCGNIKYCSCYFCNLMRWDDRESAFISEQWISILVCTLYMFSVHFSIFKTILIVQLFLNFNYWKEIIPKFLCLPTVVHIPPFDNHGLREIEL